MKKYRSVYQTILLSALVTCTGFGNEAAAVPPVYHITDLGEGAGAAINASGQVTGYTNTQHAFLWTPATPNGVSGTMQDLGTLNSGLSYGYGINDNGQVSGSSEGVAFLWSPTTPNGTSGSMVAIGGGAGINDSGQVTGSAYPPGATSSHAFLWTPTSPNGTTGTMHDLGTLGGQYSIGFGINVSGQVTGQSGTSDGVRAFLWTPTTPNGTSGSMIDLGSLGGSFSAAHGINDSGLVTGVSNTIGNAAAHAFLYDGTLHDLGTLGGQGSAGYGINASGQVTGYFQITGNVPEHAFLWTSGGGMVDLNTLIAPAAGWELQGATGINDAGQITGLGYIGGQQHAFLLTPVPEPATLALLALGLPFFVGRSSRQLRTDGARRFALAAPTQAIAVARSDQ